MKIFGDWTFKWWQVSLLKICVLSMGVLLGLYFGNFLIDYIWFFWGAFIATGVYFIIWILKN